MAHLMVRMPSYLFVNIWLGFSVIFAIHVAIVAPAMSRRPLPLVVAHGKSSSTVASHEPSHPSRIHTHEPKRQN